jgi:protein phosphatase
MDFIKRIFSGQKSPPDGAETAPLEPSVLHERAADARILVGSSQSAGVERSRNEDALLAMHGKFSGQEAMPDFGMFVVADGMGGHRSGELASSISVKAVARRLTQDTLLAIFDDQGQINPLHEVVQSALEEANHSVVDLVPGGGTTLTVALLLGDQMTIGHVGDSRAYIFTKNNTTVITRDHSLVKRLEELGQLTEEEVATHPQRNVLYKAIGQGANLEVDVATHPVPKDGYLLLCSDGLWGVVPEQSIKDIIWNSDNPQSACDELVRSANAAGGPDNITSILVYFPPD